MAKQPHITTEGYLHRVLCAFLVCFGNIFNMALHGMAFCWKFFEGRTTACCFYYSFFETSGGQQRFRRAKVIEG